MNAVTMKSFNLIAKQKKSASLVRSILINKLSAISEAQGKEDLLKKALNGDKAGIRLLNSMAVDAATTEEKFFIAFTLSELAKKGLGETLEGLELLSVGSPNYYVRQRAIYGLVKLAKNGDTRALPALRSAFEGLGLEKSEVNIRILAAEGLKYLARQKDSSAQEALRKYGITWE